MDAEVETVVVGAGPAGLAVAGRLARLGRPFVLLERGDRVGDSWHRHYRRLHLHTPRETSHLPHRPFPADWPRYVSRRQMTEYLEDYRRALGIEPRFGEEVVRVGRDVAGWRTETAGGGVFRSPHVVLATGYNRVPVEPRWPGQEGFRGTVEHCRRYLDGEPFRDRDVLVVGMGNTGAEIALDLDEHGARPALSVRGPVNIVPRDIFGRPTQRTALLLEHLPTRLGDAVGRVLRRLTVGDLSRWGIETPSVSPAAQLRRTGKAPVLDVGTVARIRRGAIRVRPAIERFLPDGVRFTDGREEPFDHVLLATGYAPGVAALVAGAGELFDAGGGPRVLSAGGRHAGLHFVGFEVRSVGGILRSIRLDSERVVAAIVQSSVAAVAAG